MGSGRKLLAVEPKSYFMRVRILLMITWKSNGRLESSVIVRFHSGISVSGSRIWTQPESKPPASGWQGLAKVDWVTEWFPGLIRCKILSIYEHEKKL